MTQDEKARARARLNRQFDWLAAKAPKARGLIEWLRKPSIRWIRIPLALLLILGGVFSFLPVFGMWMLPLGLMLLALDIPALKRPVGNTILRARRWWENFRRKP